MNFNIYLPDDIGEALGLLAKARGVARNALIRETVQELIERERGAGRWPDAVLRWQGHPDFPPFESHRVGEAVPLADPFA